jgi:hypothetical protein
MANSHDEIRKEAGLFVFVKRDDRFGILIVICIDVYFLSEGHSI